VSEWSTWTCIDSCGYTTEYRNRTCENNPDYKGYPEHCPPVCNEDLSEEAECDAGCCGKAGVWSAWQVGECNAKCGYGQREKTRICQHDTSAGVSYEHCAPECHGPARDYEDCNAGCCQQIEVWGKWSQWSCDVTCGYGRETRHRECENQSEYPDPKCEEGCGYGDPYQERECDAGCCDSIPDGYGEWSYCSVTCGDGTRHRKVFCKEQVDYHGKCPCDFPDDKEPCYSGDCNPDQCVCRLLGDPVVEQYKAGDFSILTKAKLVTLSQQARGKCAFKVEVQIGDFGEGGLIVPKYLQVTLDNGQTVVQFNDNHQINVLYSAGGADLGEYDASGDNFSLYGVGENSDIVRNGDFVVIIDRSCGTKVGYDSEGLYTTATVVVSKSNASKLKGECGECTHRGD